MATRAKGNSERLELHLPYSAGGYNGNGHSVLIKPPIAKLDPFQEVLVSSMRGELQVLRSWDTATLAKELAAAQRTLLAHRRDPEHVSPPNVEVWAGPTNLLRVYPDGMARQTYAITNATGWQLHLMDSVYHSVREGLSDRVKTQLNFERNENTTAAGNVFWIEARYHILRDDDSSTMKAVISMIRQIRRAHDVKLNPEGKIPGFHGPRLYRLGEIQTDSHTNGTNGKA